MLAIQVEYLLGRAHAAEFRDSAKPEWPPHPARLFSALVAAHHDTNGTAAEREALLWLEKQDPPHITAKAAGVADEVITFVPTNYAAKSGSTHPEQRVKQPRSFPAQGPESPIVRFVWPTMEAPARYTEALERLTARVPSLGRACSLVRMSVIESDAAVAQAESNYVPDDAGKEILAVAGDGRLEELERTYLAQRRPQQGSPARYNHGDSGKGTAEAEGHFGEMIVLRRMSGVGFPIESTTLLTKRLRKAFLSQAGEGGQLNAMLSGHEGELPGSAPHVAFAALPNVGGQFSDGRLMGLAVILPRSISRMDRRKALRACASLNSMNLGDGLGEWELEIANFDVAPLALQTNTWMRRSLRWTSVTPILLDRYPKKDLTAEELLVTACQRAGLPLPSHCSYGTHPDSDAGLKGVPPVFAFAPSRWAIHATLEFRVAVKGPVLIGAGRFFGMGLMKPVQGRAKDERR